jgi:hypothetical protein
MLRALHNKRAMLLRKAIAARAYQRNANRDSAQERRKRLGRYSVYLLYWYKSTHTDAEALLASAESSRWIRLKK